MIWSMRFWGVTSYRKASRKVELGEIKKKKKFGGILWPWSWKFSYTCWSFSWYLPTCPIGRYIKCPLSVFILEDYVLPRRFTSVLSVMYALRSVLSYSWEILGVSCCGCHCSEWKENEGEGSSSLVWDSIHMAVCCCQRIPPSLLHLPFFTLSTCV